MEMATASQEAAFAKRLGQAIAKRRTDAGLTQEQLAEQIAVEQETISRFERGATLPPLGRLAEIADALDMPLEALLRASSLRLQDQAHDMAAMLAQLREADRAWVRDWLKELIEKLAR